MSHENLAINGAQSHADIATATMDVRKGISATTFMTAIILVTQLEEVRGEVEGQLRQMVKFVGLTENTVTIRTKTLVKKEVENLIPFRRVVVENTEDQ